MLQTERQVGELAPGVLVSVPGFQSKHDLPTEQQGLDSGVDADAAYAGVAEAAAVYHAVLLAVIWHAETDRCSALK
jgi:hypothetical protein